MEKQALRDIEQSLLNIERELDIGHLLGIENRVEAIKKAIEGLPAEAVLYEITSRLDLIHKDLRQLDHWGIWAVLWAFTSTLLLGLILAVLVWRFW